VRLLWSEAAPPPGDGPSRSRQKRACFMITGTSDRMATESARDHGNGAGPWAESGAAGAGATIEVPGPSRPPVTPQEPHQWT
jgi:hypothetical protein